MMQMDVAVNDLEPGRDCVCVIVIISLSLYIPFTLRDMSSAYEKRLLVSAGEALGRLLTMEERARLIKEHYVVKGPYVRSPASALSTWLRLLLPLGTGLEHWIMHTARGTQWLTRQQLIYPQLARDASTLWMELGQYPHDHGLYQFGRPVDYDLLDEWIYLSPPAASTLSHGDLGDAGGAAQHAGLYWEDGQGIAEEEGVVDHHVALRMDLDRAMQGLTSTTSVF